MCGIGGIVYWDRRLPDRGQVEALEAVDRLRRGLGDGPADALLAGRLHADGVVEDERAADLHDPVHGRRGPAGLVQRRARGEHVTGVEADAGTGVVVEGGEVRLEVLDARAQRLALARGGLEQQPRRAVVGPQRLEDREEALADLAHRGLGAAGGHA